MKLTIYLLHMNQRNIIALIKELTEMDELHQQYQDNDINFVIDARREGNHIHIDVELQENKDKKEFEAWANQFDDDLFTEIWESLSKKYNLKDLNDVYESKNFRKVINLFKKEADAIIKKKIASLQQLIG